MDKLAMLDLETLDIASTAAIIQIGMAITDKDYNIIERFKVTIDFDSAAQYGTISGGTVKWWMSQSKEAQDSVTKATVGLTRALKMLSAFMEEHSISQVWAHATFDFPVLDNAYRKVGIDNPIKFWNTRDLRTIEELYGKQVKIVERDNVHHDALADAEYQLERLIKLMEVHNVSN